MTNATEIAKPFKRTNPGHIDLLYGPYDSLEEACREVPNATKEVDGVEKNFRTGQVVGINTFRGIEEYWWSKGTADAELILKTIDVSGLATKDEAEDKIPVKEKGRPFGVATLSINGKVDSNQLNLTGFSYKGYWDPNLNLPELSLTSSLAGDTYYILTTGTHDFGSGPEVFTERQKIIFNGANWDQVEEREDIPTSSEETFEQVFP